MKDSKITKEMLEKAKAASGAEELIAIAKEFGIELQPSEAQELFAELRAHGGELNDEELNDVAGGSWQRPAIRPRWPF